jgi:excisionase family DNA binding protein
MGFFQRIASLRRVALELPEELAQLADQINADTEALIEEVPAVTASEAATELGVSKPTVLAWIDAGRLLAAPIDGQHRTRFIDPKSIAMLTAPLQEWEAAGRPGRPGTFVSRWLDDWAKTELSRAKARRGVLAGRDPHSSPGAVTIDSSGVHRVGHEGELSLAGLRSTASIDGFRSGASLPASLAAMPSRAPARLQSLAMAPSRKSSKTASRPGRGRRRQASRRRA